MLNKMNVTISCQKREDDIFVFLNWWFFDDLYTAQPLVEEREKMIEMGLIPRSEVSYGELKDEEQETAESSELQTPEKPKSESAVYQSPKSMSWHLFLETLQFFFVFLFEKDNILLNFEFV